MNGLRPSMCVTGNMFRYFTRKKDNKQIMSQIPEYDFVSRTSQCREEVLNGIYRSVSNGFRNERVRHNPYKLKLKGYVKHKNKEYFGKSSIVFEMDNIKTNSLINSNSSIKRTIRYLNLFVGLLDVVVFHNDDDRIRKAKGYGHHNHFEVINNELHYNVLSSKWLVSEPVASIFLGFARDALTIAYNDGSKLLEEFSEREINRIINECDNESAYHIIFNKIIPYLRRYYFEDPYEYIDEDFVICHNDVEGFLKMYEKGDSSYNNEFNPENAGDCWDIDMIGDEFGYGIIKYLGLDDDIYNYGHDDDD